MKTYKCAMCQGEFEEGWSDEEATAELREHFGSIIKEECDVVCEDCHQKMHPAKYPHLVEQAMAEHLRARNEKPPETA